MHEVNSMDGGKQEHPVKVPKADDKKSWFQARCRDIEPCRAWVALAAAVLTNFLLGLSDSFGVYYNALVERYDASRAEVGWVFSIRWIFIFISAIFISPFIDKCGCKPVALVFGTIYALGTALSAFAPNIGSLYFIYGVLTGLGDSGIYMAEVTAIQLFFSTNRGLATGISALGFPLSVAIHPLHTQFFLSTYGVGGVFLLHGAFSFHAVVCAFAYKTPSDAKKTTSSPPNSTTIGGGRDGRRTEDVQRCNSVPDPEASQATKPKCDAVKTYLKDLFDFSLLKNAGFVLSIVHYLLLWAIRLGVTTQIVNCAKFRGIPNDYASYLLSIAGLTSLFMTVFSAAVMNMRCLNSAMYSGLASLCLTGSAAGCAFSHSYGMFAASAVALGMADGIATANLPLLVLYTVDLESFPRGMALLWTLLAPSAVGSSSFVGWMVDMLNDYVVPFIILAVIGIISFILAVIITLLVNRKNRIKSHTPSTVVETEIVLSTRL